MCYYLITMCIPGVYHTQVEISPFSKILEALEKSQYANISKVHNLYYLPNEMRKRKTNKLTAKPKKFKKTPQHKPGLTK